MKDDVTLRDYFAGAALAGLLADSTVQAEVDETPEEFQPRITGLAYEYADAMLASRESTP